MSRIGIHRANRDSDTRRDRNARRRHILAVMQSTCSALCWILGHKQGELFMTLMALLETALKKLGYEEVTIH